jgi:hypothetical protein
MDLGLKTHPEVLEKFVSIATSTTFAQFLVLTALARSVHVSDIESVELGLLGAIAHIGAGNAEASVRAVDSLCEHIARIRGGLSSGVEEEVG